MTIFRPHATDRATTPHLFKLRAKQGIYQLHYHTELEHHR